jgi:drug/metabolite transporter (DMT)-like permease
MPPFTAVAIRFAIASVILLGIARGMKVELGKRPYEKTIWAVNGFFSFCASYGVVYWCEQYVPSGLSALLFALFPILVALMAHFAIPGERLRPRSIVGIAIGFAGIATLFSEDFAKLGGRKVLIASVIMLVAPFVSAISSVVIKRLGSGIHPISIAAVPMAFGGGVMAVLAIVFERHRTIVWTPATLGALAYLSIFGSAVSFTLYYWLLRRLPASRVSLIAYVTPVVAVAVGVMFLDEPLTARLVAGAVLVIAGVALAGS